MLTPPFVVGIDPGLDGYVCILRGDGPPRFHAVPTHGTEGHREVDRRELLRIVGRHVALADLVLIERQQIRPRQAGAWKIGFGYGLWLMALEAAFGGPPPVVEVEPSLWKTALGLTGGSKSQRKARSIARARSLYPDVDLRPLERTSGARVPSHDKAEALLLAHVARGQALARANAQTGGAS